MIQYTSGTTGFPKGALRCSSAREHDLADRMGVPEGGTWVCPMPLFTPVGVSLACFLQSQEVYVCVARGLRPLVGVRAD